MSNHPNTVSYIRYEPKQTTTKFGIGVRAYELTRVEVTRSWLNTGRGPKLTITHVKEVPFTGFSEEVRRMTSYELDGWGSVQVDRDAELAPSELKQYLRETGHVTEPGHGQSCLMLNDAAWASHIRDVDRISMGLEPSPITEFAVENDPLTMQNQPT
jgi:hypothetical protein